MTYAVQIFTDKWFTPIIKLFIDQTAWAVTWNSLYYCLLGEPSLYLYYHYIYWLPVSVRPCPFAVA